MTTFTIYSANRTPIARVQAAGTREAFQAYLAAGGKDYNASPSQTQEWKSTPVAQFL